MLICSKCKGARRGPSASDIRKHLKKELGKPKSLRVLEVECLKLCPDDAVATCVVDAEHPNVKMHVLRSTEDLAQLTDTIAKQQR